MMSFLWEKTVFNNFKCSSSGEVYLHVSRYRGEQSSIGADEILCFFSRFQETVQGKLCSPNACEAGRCSPSPKFYYGLFLLDVTPELLHPLCCFSAPPSCLTSSGQSFCPACWAVREHSVTLLLLLFFP